MPTFKVSELARRVGAEVTGDPERSLTGVASLASAGPGDLSFFAREDMRAAAEETGAGAVLVPLGFDPAGLACAVLTVDEPHLAFARILPLFQAPDPPPAIHPTVSIGRGAEIGEEVSLAAGVVVEAGARIGARTRVGPGALIGGGARVGTDCRIGHGVSVLHDVRIGDRAIIHPGVRIGTDGFGYAAGPQGAYKVPQVGGCAIGDDVEIGANCTIDRGALDDTTIGDRTKLDNLVHIAHNVRIGTDCMIVAQVGIAGSAEIGDGAQLGGQAGIVGHLSIGPGARIAAQSGVMRDVAAGDTHGGYPAQPHRQWMKTTAATRKLPELGRRVAAIERRLGPDADASEGEEEDGGG